MGALTEHSKTPNDANPKLKLTPAEGHRFTEMSCNTNWSSPDAAAFQNQPQLSSAAFDEVSAGTAICGAFSGSDRC
jgi:hypothetical protein